MDEKLEMADIQLKVFSLYHNPVFHFWLTSFSAMFAFRKNTIEHTSVTGNLHFVFKTMLIP